MLDSGKTLIQLPQEFGFLWQGTMIFACVAACSFWACGLYRGIWYYASFDDMETPDT